jgi:aminoglycoside phosphotransferase (APT) family kinase protein
VSEPKLDLGSLRAFLDRSGVPVAGQLASSIITGGRSNLTYRVSDGTSTWVLRRPPAAGLSPSAHDVGREYGVIAALADTAVPVAPVIVRCDDPAVLGVPFTLVEFVPGTVLVTQRDLDVIDDAQVADCHRELIRVLSALHAIDPDSVGLGQLGRPDGFAARQVQRWRKQWDYVRTRELSDVDGLFRALEARVPARSDSAIVHGDYRVDNSLLDPNDLGQMLALVDWEMATLGDPLTDLGTMCAYQNHEFDQVVGAPAASTSPRWPNSQQILQDYAVHSGRDLSDIPFYLALAHFKLAVVAEGIHSRHLAGAGTGAGFETAGLAVPGLLAAGLAALGGS